MHPNLNFREDRDCHTELVVKKLITQYMLESYLFYTVDCWRNINLWCKIVYVKSIAYITYNNFIKKMKLAS